MAKLKFRECVDCANQSSAICVRCGAGEFFEEKTPEFENETFGEWITDDD